MKLETQLTIGHRQNFFATRVVKDWNALAEATVTAPNISTFKAALAKDWRDVDKFSYNF